jgi:hypothetical protein
LFNSYQYTCILCFLSSVKLTPTSLPSVHTVRTYRPYIPSIHTVHTYLPLITELKISINNSTPINNPRSGNHSTEEEIINKYTGSHFTSLFGWLFNRQWSRPSCGRAIMRGVPYNTGQAVAQLLEAMRYKPSGSPEGRINLRQK